MAIGLPDTTEGMLTIEQLLAGQPRLERERVVRRIFGVSIARYHHELNKALDDPRAPVLGDAQMVERLRRIRDQRREKRTARRIA
jgi:hypothetical protein